VTKSTPKIGSAVPPYKGKKTRVPAVRSGDELTSKPKIGKSQKTSPEPGKNTRGKKKQKWGM